MHPNAIARLRAEIPAERLSFDQPMAPYTTFRIGGPADALIDAASTQEIQGVVRLCRAFDIPLTVIGNGSNLLVGDGGIRGVVLRVHREMSAHRVQGNCLQTQAGALLSVLARAATQAGLSGLAWAEGVPGTAGGAATMNAGAYGGEMCQNIQQIKAVDAQGELVTLSLNDLHFGYRHSALQACGLIATEVTFALTPGDSAIIANDVRTFAEKRRSKQPLELPSAGSTFKRPATGYAAQLIDEAGLKGVRVGGAQVSEKHAGFIVNRGGATAADVLALVAHVQQAVFEQRGIRLEPEMRIIGEFA